MKDRPGGGMKNNERIGASQFPGKNGGERIQAAIDSLGTTPKIY